MPCLVCGMDVPRGLVHPACDPFVVNGSVVLYRRFDSEKLERLNELNFSAGIVELVSWAREVFGTRFWRVTQEACDWIDLGDVESVRYGVALLHGLRLRAGLETEYERLYGLASTEVMIAALIRAEVALAAGRLGEVRDILGETSSAMDALGKLAHIQQERSVAPHRPTGPTRGQRERARVQAAVRAFSAATALST